MNKRTKNNQDSRFRNGMTDGSLHDNEAKMFNGFSSEGVNQEEIITEFYVTYCRCAANDRHMYGGGTISPIPYVLSLYGDISGEIINAYHAIEHNRIDEKMLIQACVEVMIAAEVLARNSKDDFEKWQTFTTIMSTIKYDYLLCNDTIDEEIRNKVRNIID